MISRSAYVHLLSAQVLESSQDEVEKLLNWIIKGQLNEVLVSSHIIRTVLDHEQLHALTNSNEDQDINQLFDDIISLFVSGLSEQLQGDQDLVSEYLLVISITFLQAFVQLNFTGPYFDVQLGALKTLTGSVHDQKFISALSSMGQLAYELAEAPVLLCFAIKILELLNKSTVSFVGFTDIIDDTEHLVSKANVQKLDKEADVFMAVVQWWRSRAYQIQTSLLPEPSSILTSVSSALLNNSVLSTMIQQVDESEGKTLALVYYLETARNGLNTNTENISVNALAKARKISGLDLVLTGCKAKRTKYQQEAHSSLIILAANATVSSDHFDNNSNTPLKFDLNNDVLLEKPLYESVGGDGISELLSEEDSSLTNKRLKLDLSDVSLGEAQEDLDAKLLPIAIREDTIPQILKDLDPNDQPRLADLDMAQLLLRFVAVKQTSPSNSSLVEEELMALIQRILFSPDGSVNWSIFSKSLWERSLLETSKAKTVERGVLQMQSIVEELGMSSLKSNLFAKHDGSEDSGENPARRLKLVHQLPLTPKWTMDAQLAEKFMSLGVLRSALEIYERLHLWNEVALCHAAVGSEKEALEVLETHLANNPRDTRALSIIGDIKQDPSFWLKSWELARYPKAKNSLAKYYYSPPKSSGLEKNIVEAIKHQYDALSINPLSFESWYFYGCLGLEAANYDLAAEAFSRCISLDDDNAHAWSNLSSALVKLDKLKPALNALQKAVKVGRDLKSWRIWENYLIVAAKLRQYDDVLLASRQLLVIMKDSNGENAIDLPVVEKLVEVLISEPYDPDNLNHFQRSCIEFVCVSIPQVINTSARCWRVISKVELWRQKPWAALDVLEKAYRSLLTNPQLEFEQSIWDEAVESCVDMVAAYENYGELPGRHGSGDVVCKDWKYKSKTSVRSLISRGKNSWADTEGFQRLQDMKDELMN